MAAVFKDHPEALRNTMLVAERCNVTIPKGQNHLPSFGVPEGFTLDAFLEHVAREGFAQRMVRLQQLAGSGRLRQSIDEYSRRLDYEIAMIRKIWATRATSSSSGTSSATRVRKVSPLDLVEDPRPDRSWRGACASPTSTRLTST